MKPTAPRVGLDRAHAATRAPAGEVAHGSEREIGAPAIADSATPFAGELAQALVTGSARERLSLPSGLVVLVEQRTAATEGPVDAAAGRTPLPSPRHLANGPAPGERAATMPARGRAAPHPNPLLADEERVTGS